MKLLTNLALITFASFLFTGLVQAQITENSVGKIHLGMTIAELRKVVDARALSYKKNNDDVQMIEVKQNNEVTIILVTDTKELGIPEHSKITSIEVLSAEHKTANGVHVGMLLKEAVTKYGKLGNITFHEDTNVEDVTFINQPDSIWFKVISKSGKVGQYLEGGSVSERYSDDATIKSITIETFLSSKGKEEEFDPADDDEETNKKVEPETSSDTDDEDDFEDEKPVVTPTVSKPILAPIGTKPTNRNGDGAGNRLQAIRNTNCKLMIIPSHKVACWEERARTGSMGEKDLKGSYLRDSNLHKSGNLKLFLRSADFSNSKLQKTQFGSVLADGANFTKANLEAAYFSNADLRNGIFVGANMVRILLTSCDLRGANLSNAKLNKMSGQDVKFIDANLTGADLSGAYLPRADFTGANLTGAILTGAEISPQTKGIDHKDWVRRGGIVLIH